MSYKEDKADGSYIERACSTASSLGTVVGRTVNWITVSYRNMVKGSRNYDNLDREERILSRLNNVRKHLHKIEKGLRNSNAAWSGRTFNELEENDIGSNPRNETGPILSIVQGLNHPEPKVRAAAVARAIKTGTFSEVYFLILLLDDPVPDIRRQAWVAIRKIVDIDFEFDPEEEETIRRAKIEELKKWWKEERIDKL